MPKMALVVLESDLEDLFLVTVQEAKLVNHGLHRVLEVWAYTFKHAHVVKLERQQGRPPANGKVLAVHAVEATIFCNPAKETTSHEPRNGTTVSASNDPSSCSVFTLRHYAPMLLNTVLNIFSLKPVTSFI